MRHDRIIAAHAPNCACPRCRHLRFIAVARAIGDRCLSLGMMSAGVAGATIIGRAAFAVAARALAI